ncbi:MAG TPA: hypothetical protein DCZ94_20465 [Lentisphaeria bacterium]|nr:hypothetical protein [Lentisphaeria bacterium]
MNNSLYFYVYILLCNDGSYYVGQTEDLDARIRQHNSGRACRYTACRSPVKLVYHEEQMAYDAAVKRELQIKKWSKAKKRALIEGNIGKLKELSHR